MKFKLTFAILLVVFGLVNAEGVPCLPGCSCDFVPDPIIRCDYGNFTDFPLPITLPRHNITILALTCNDIRTLPSVRLILEAFPDLHGIDLQGNDNLNCSSLEQFEGKIAVLSDCRAKTAHVCNRSLVSGQITRGFRLGEFGTIMTGPENFLDKLFDSKATTDTNRLKKLWESTKQITSDLKLDQLLRQAKSKFNTIFQK
ncbi:unnamed protein product [Caenorhabditis sp. 36 PRJEB53466]|nr:unnamed protein product [Caenorhabditis sp. 36 PRJEB53466]